MTINDQDSPIYDLSGSRAGPRSSWYSRRSAFIFLTLFIFGSFTLYIAEHRHPIATPVAAVAFLVYGVLDYHIAHKLMGSDARWKQICWAGWNWAGVLGPIFVYFWIVRGSGITGPILLWPLLVYPFYFLIRLIRPSRFFSWMLLLVFGLPVIAYALSELFSTSDQPSYNIASAIWLLVTLLIISIHLRTWDYHKNRFDAYRSLVKWAGSADAKLEDVGLHLSELGAQLKLERLTVLEVFRPYQTSDLRQIEGENLSIPEGADVKAIRPPLYVKIIAKYLTGHNDENIQPWPLTRGLLEYSYQKRKHVDCPDTASPPWNELFYNPKDGTIYDNTRCEFVMPIWDSPDGEIIGFVDLQSKAPNSLPIEDLDYLGALSSAIAPLINKARLERLMTGLQSIRFALEKTKDELDIFGLVATFARDYLDADVVTYYKLGFGTGWPLLPPMQLGAWYPHRLQDPEFRREDAPPIYLASKWRAVYESDSKSNKLLLPRSWESMEAHDFFIFREQIQSTVFLPIGIPSRRVAALFLNFRKLQTFSPTFYLVLEILRQIITPHLENARQIDETYKGFGQTAFVLHDLLRESLGTSFFFEPYLAQLKKAIDENNQMEMETVLGKLGNTLAVHTKSIRTAYLKSALNHHRKLEEGLDSAFRSAAGWLEEQYAGRSFRWDLNPPSLSIKLTYDLRLAINSIIVEAVHNAIRHGQAGLVKVRIWREERQISISVLSDGLSWDPENPAKPYSEYGISARLTLAHDRMNAASCWNIEGRQLLVNIPILPSIDGKDPYVNEASSNRG